MPDQALAPLDQARRLFRDVRQYLRVRKNPALSNVGANKIANVILPTGETYYRIDLLCTVAGAAATAAQMISDITDIKLTVDGDPKWECTGEDAVALARYYQTRQGVDPIQSGVLPIMFNRPWHREITGEDDGAWGTLDVRSLTLEISLKNGAVIDAIATRRWVGDGEPLGRHLCIRRKPRPAPGITTIAAPDRVFQWTNNLGTALLAIHANTVTGTRLTDVGLQVDNIIEMESEYGVLLAQYLQYERTPQTTAHYQHIDFCARGRLKDAFPMIAQTMNLDLIWGVDPGAYTLILEQIEGPVAG